MNYNIESVERPEDKRKGAVGATTFVTIILILLFIPFFNTIMEEFQEEGGVMASFGNVDMAGGGGDPTPTPQPTPPVQEEVKEEIPEETETTENEEDTPVEQSPVEEQPVEEKQESKPSTNTNPNPNPIDEGSLFPGGPGPGNGNREGGGTMGTSNGTNTDPGIGQGDFGTGTGKLGNRKKIRDCKDIQQQAGSFSESGDIYVDIFVDAQGVVTKATINTNKTTIVNPQLKELAVKCAKMYRYEGSSSAKNFPRRSKGTIKVNIGNI